MDKSQFAAYHTEAKVAELHTAFDLVANKENWKFHIDAIVKLTPGAPATVNDISEAVTFFTGSVPTFTFVSKDVYRVCAAGYYATIGA